MMKKHKNHDRNSHQGGNAEAGSEEPENNNEQTPEQPASEQNPQAQEEANAELSALKEKIAELEKKLAESDDRFLRLRADFDNFRKRASRDILDARVSSRVDTIIPFLNVLDHFHLAMGVSDDSKDVKALKEGMKLILAEFEKAMAELDVTTISAVGQEFNPNMHEAIGKQSSDSHKEGIIISQLRRGYKFGDRLIRPCTVIVSDGPAKPAQDAQPNSAEIPAEDE